LPCALYPRDILSFPTRRSSDLVVNLVRFHGKPIRFIRQLCVVLPYQRYVFVENTKSVFIWCLQVAGNFGKNEQARAVFRNFDIRSEEHTSELQSRENLVCRLLL